MRIHLWLAKRTQRRIENYEQKIRLFQDYITKTRAWVRQEKKILDKQLKELSLSERIKFGHETGYLEEDILPKH